MKIVAMSYNDIKPLRVFLENGENGVTFNTK